MSVRRRILAEPGGRIYAVQYSPAANVDTGIEACVTITNDATVEAGLPRNGGIFDTRMGTTDGMIQCGTCKRNKDKCHGHPGMIDFGDHPQVNPIAFGEVKKWLRVICWSCHDLVFSDASARAYITKPHATGPYLNRLKNAQLPLRCERCDEPHPVIKRPEHGSQLFTYKIANADGTMPMASEQLTPFRIREILSAIQPKTLAFLRVSSLVHPVNYVFTAMYVPPPAIRPDVRKGGNQMSNDPMTVGFRAIFRAHNAVSTYGAMDAKRKTLSGEANVADMIRATLVSGSEHDPTSVASRFKSKKGHIRATILGKRINGSARSTIDGSPHLNLDQISLPLFVAQTLCIYETVQSFNRARVMTYVANGTRSYPGCSRIIKRDGSMYKPDATDLVIEDGDIVVRNLVNGDIVMFNRQPTLALSNITAVRIVIDDRALAVGMSVIVCPYFNADFDGDQMNQFNVALPSSINEQLMLTCVSSRLVSAVTGSMSVGQADDSLTGNMKLTQPGVEIDKYHSCVVCSTMIIAPDLEGTVFRGRGTVSGRELLSCAFARTPVTYRGKSGYYSSNALWARFMPDISTDASAQDVRVVDGRILSGCFDKTTVGSGGSSIYQSIAHDFGARATIDTIFDMQQIGTNYIIMHGFTTGMRDFHLSADARARIKQCIEQTLARAHVITAKLDEGRIIPPIDKTLAQYYEELQINAQRINDDFYEPIFTSFEDRETNGMFEMLTIGKGSPIFLVNMVGAVGLILINGERAMQNYSNARTLPYFQRYDESPESRGFAGANFANGLSLVSSIFNMMVSRTDIITRALYTAVTGDQNRRSEKNLEGIITNNHRMNVKGNTIVSFVYGGDYFDVRQLVNVTYGPAMISDGDMERKYKYVSKGAHARVFDDEYATLLKDRAQYRAIYKQLEESSVRNKMGATIKMPFNLEHIAEMVWRRVIHALDDNEGATDGARIDDMYAEVARMVVQYCEDVPYLYTNEAQRQTRAPISDASRWASRLLCMYVRSELCSARLSAMLAQFIAEANATDDRHKYNIGNINIVDFARSVLDIASAHTKLAIIDPGTLVGILASTSFSEPFTQDMLDSYKTSAITGGNVGRTKMSVCREVLKAFPVKKMSNPQMTLILEDQYASSEEGALEIARRVEMLRFSQLVLTSHIFCEKFGMPVHPDYVGEREIFDAFARDNPMLARDISDLSPWCMYFKLSKSALVQKRIDVTTIVERLRVLYPELVLIYTLDRAPNVIIRAYIRESAIKTFGAHSGEVLDSELLREKRAKHRSASGDATIKWIRNVIMSTVLRGVSGVLRARVGKIIRTKVEADGRIVDAPSRWAVFTTGTNLTSAVCVSGIIPEQSRSNAIQEIAATLGISAARYFIISAMRELVEKCSVKHYMIYADEMTRLGRVTPIECNGVNTRDADNVSLRAALAAPLQAFSDAAFNARRDVVTGMSGPLMYGSIPRAGTLYNTFAIDGDVVAEHARDVRSQIEEL